MVRWRVALLSVVVLAVSGCGGGPASVTGSPLASPARTSAVPAGVVPAALVGSWTQAAASSSQVCDDAGHCTGAYGGSESYTFTEDARFEYSQFLQSNLGGCELTTFLSVTGRITADANSVTLISEDATNSKTDTCTEDTAEHIDIDPTSYDWRTDAAADGHPQLYLSNAAGTTGPLDPKSS